MIMTLQRDDEGTPDGKIKKPQAEDLWKEVRVDGLVYRVQSISPETPDRWRTAIRPLVVFLIAIFAAAALVGIFGAPLREWAKATPVFPTFSRQRNAARAPSSPNTSQRNRLAP